MKQQLKPRPPAHVVAEHAKQAVEVAHSPVRCPYCHDSCTAQTLDAIVCQECLSRHHGACWREGRNTCASCGSKQALSGSPAEIEVAPAELALLRRGLPREAVERLARRLEIGEAQATQALLEAASLELGSREKTSIFGLPAWAVVAISICALPFITAICGILFG